MSAAPLIFYKVRVFEIALGILSEGVAMLDESLNGVHANQMFATMRDSESHEERGASEAREDARWNGSGEKEVLVVDDNEQAADALVRLLVALGFKAYAEYSGKGALQLLMRHRPQYVFLDIGMPEMDGYEVIRRIKERDLSGMRIIALTGYGLAEDKERAMQAGFDDHLTKPIGVKELRSILS